jgi:RNA polymerase sigma factor (sigma-70 family)
MVMAFPLPVLGPPLTTFAGPLKIEASPGSGTIAPKGTIMSEESTFQQLIRRVRGGDEEAAMELVRTYEPAIRRAARLRLGDARLQRLFDSMDICQSVFASFFVRAALGQYELDSPEQLLKLLVTMSRRKLVDHAREQGAARRDYRRLRTGDQVEGLFVAGDASPSQQVAARELLQKFRQRLSPEERRLAELRAEGRDWAEIAAEQGATPEALRKRLARAVNRVAADLGLEGFHHG